MRFFCWLILLFGLGGCGLLNQNVMFRTKESIKSSKAEISAVLQSAEKNYLIQKGDYIEVRVFSNNAEIIIAPPQLTPETRNQSLQNQGGGINQGFIQQQNNTNAALTGNQYPLSYPSFLVEQNGGVKLPMIGEVKLENLTLRQADSLLETKFIQYYEQPYIRTRYTNKRVIVFKGKEAHVFPLRNEKVHLIEVLAATGGMGVDLKASNIRLIRGDLQDPTVYLINLKRMSGVMKQNLVVEPNDIIYVEPNYLQSINNLTPILTVITTILTLSFLLRR